MPSIEEILSSGRIEKLSANKIRSERADVISQIYPSYQKSTKKENWKRYIKWLKETKSKHSFEKVILFRKEKSFLKTRDIKSFSIMLSHIPAKDLYYILSIAKDKENRNENFSGWLMGEIYRKEEKGAISDNSSTLIT